MPSPAFQNEPRRVLRASGAEVLSESTAPQNLCSHTLYHKCVVSRIALLGKSHIVSAVEAEDFQVDSLLQEGVEGVRQISTARLAGVQENTVASLALQIGEDCQDFLRARVRNINVSHLEVDEVWTFVKKKQKRVTHSDPATVGDAYTYIALDRAARLVVASHVGKRDAANTALFVLNVREATSCKRFQVSSDGWEAYEWALEAGLSDRASYGRIVKVTPPGRVEAVFGNPDVNEIEMDWPRFRRRMS